MPCRVKPDRLGLHGRPCKLQVEGQQVGGQAEGQQEEGKKRMGSNIVCLAPSCGLFINTTALKVPGRSLSRVLIEPNPV